MSDRIEVRTHQREELVDITGPVQDAVRGTGIDSGVLYLWSMHTTCGLTVNEGADPDVQRDIAVTLRRLVPHRGDYQHAEGNSDSHLKTLMTGPGQTLLIEDGRPVLGTWQKVFLAEWDGPRTRKIAWKVIPG